MYPFEYYIPTKIVFGEGTVKRTGEIASGFGKKAMLVSYDEDLIKRIGFYDKAMEPLKAAGIEVFPLFGVKSNPDVSLVREGIKICKEQKPDVVIALGGGSVMDTAKGIAVGACYDGDVWDFPTGKAEIKDALPIMTIVTIPATSSEMNPTSVLNNDEIRRKDGFVSPLMFPKVSILDPELTYTLPMKQTAISAADIVSHLMEGYINHKVEWAPMQDRYAQGMIRTIMDSMDRLQKDLLDKEARAMFMWTATFAWNGFYVCGLGAFDQIIHIVGHSFSAFYDVPHGSAMSVSIPAVMKFHLDERIEKFSGFAKEVFGIEGDVSKETAQKGIDALVDWFKKIDVPVTFAEANMPTDELDAMTDDILETAERWGTTSYTKDMIMDILKLAI
ncbi:MAG: iron-containing alcohol dehydrogenase [Clostridiales bacterium]|nr:iron-containing alcohol dehydrogenase [Clostridiales bacterium]